MKDTGKELHGLPETEETAVTSPDRFAANLARATQEGMRAWQMMLESSSKEKPAANPFDPFHLAPAFAQLGQNMIANPDATAKRAFSLMEDQSRLLQRQLEIAAGKDSEDVPPVIEPSKGDRRFKDEDWSSNPLFDYLKQTYLLNARYLTETAENAGEMSPRDQRKVSFFTTQLIDALSPSNFAQTNPEVLRTTLTEQGDNLARGMEMLAEDVERNNGRFLARQTALGAYELGIDMAVTPGEVVWQGKYFQLLRYAPTTDEVYEVPLLFVPPWINKYYILDLNEKKSMVQWLVAQGFTVFLISWVNPDAQHSDADWQTYMEEGVLRAIDEVLLQTGSKQINIAGYCIGGTMLATTLARLGQDGDERIASATFFTAQTDFTDAGELQVFVDEETLKTIDMQMESGVLPAGAMAQAFNMLRSRDLVWNYVVSDYLLGREPAPFDLLQWNSDATAMPAPLHHFYLSSFYDRNEFAQGKFEVGGRNLKPSDIAVPIYHLAAREDHIAPVASVFRGAKEMTGTPELRFVMAGSGHIAGVVNPPASGKYQHWTDGDMAATSIDEWQQGATETAGSWWPDWANWLGSRAGKKVKAQPLPAGIEPAPGSYVRASGN